jgi:hypothetical protein
VTLERCPALVLEPTEDVANGAPVVDLEAVDARQVARGDIVE